MSVRYEIEDSTYDTSTQSSKTSIAVIWPYGEPTPPIVQPNQVLYLNSSKYRVDGYEYEPALNEGEEHLITYWVTVAGSGIF